MENKYEECWENFWKDIVCDGNGNLDLVQVKKELSDYSFMLEEVPKVYCDITGGAMSYPNYYAATVISVANDYTERLYRKRPSYEYEIFESDRCTIEIDGIIKYFKVEYDSEDYMWVAVFYTNQQFLQSEDSTPLPLYKIDLSKAKNLDTDY